MNKLIPLIVAAGMLTIYACSDKQTESDAVVATDSTMADPASTATQVEATIPAGDAATIQMDPNQQAPSATPVVTPQGAPVTSTPVAGAQSGLNPAHGEPGHRCEIAVGAPLSSAPAASAPSPTIAPSGNVQLPNSQQGSTNQQVQFQESPGSAPNTMTTAPAAGASPVVTAPGMNPPHGQPGHDCNIAVGAPLKK